MSRASAVSCGGDRLRLTSLLVGGMLVIETVCFTLVTPLLADYQREYRLSSLTTGVLAAAFPAGIMVGAIPSAILVGRAGVQRTTWVGFSLLAAASVVFGVADSSPLLTGSRFVQGLAGATIWTGALGWLSALAPIERRGELLGNAVGIAVAGSLLGPAAGALAEATSPELVLGLVAALAVLAAAGSSRILPRPAAPTGRWEPLASLSSRESRRWLALLAWIVLVTTVAFGLVNVLGPLELDALGAGTAAIAAVFLLVAAGEAMASPLAGRLADRRGHLWPIRLALPVLAVLMALFLPIDHALLLSVVIVAVGVAMGFCWTPAMARISAVTDDAGLAPGQAFALFNFMFAAGNVIGGGGGGALTDLAGAWLPFTLLVVLLLVTAGAVASVSATRRAPLEEQCATAPDPPC